jgi:WD40 repeat protein
MAFVAPAGGTSTLLAIWAEPGVVALWEVGGNSPAPVTTQKFAGLSLLGVTPGGAIVVGDGDLIKIFEASAFAASSPPEPLLALPGAIAAATGGFARLTFSADGRRMALARSAAAGGKASVWDLGTRESIGSGFNWLQSATPGKSDDVFLAPDGSSLVVSSDAATVVWRLDQELWAEKVCRAAGRNLTEAEWTKYFPGRDYAVTCEMWPARPRI